MAGITSTGFGSGLPINDLVSQLVSAEGSPAKNQLDKREASLQAELSSIGVLKSALSDFQSSLTKLTDASNFTSRTAASSDTDIATLSAEQTASIGSYSLEVQQLATAHKLVGQQGYTDGDTGSLTFSNASGDSFSIDITSDNATLEGIRDTINGASDNFGVTATILNLSGGPRLVLTANDTGADNRITGISSTSTSGDLSIFDYSYASNSDPALDGDNANFDQVTAAADAQFTLEGQALTSPSNTIDSVIPDVTLTLKNTTGTGSPITLTVGTNAGSAKTMITDFVKAYNTLQSTIAKQTSYNADTGQAGTLLGDAMTRTIQSQLRSLLSGTYEDGGTINHLVQLGITTTRDGQLEVDSSKLSDALSNNFSDVTAFFSGNNGLANKIDSTLDTYLKSSGTFASRTDSINTQISDIEDQRTALSERLDKLQTRLLNQFNAMDSMVAQLNSSGNFLLSQLDSINQIGSSNKSSSSNS